MVKSETLRTLKTLFACIEHAIVVSGYASDPSIICCSSIIRDALNRPEQGLVAKTQIENLYLSEMKCISDTAKIQLLTAMLWIGTGIRNGDARMPKDRVLKKCAEAVRFAELQWQERLFRTTELDGLKAPQAA